jgi:hypothetical protein
VLLLWFLFLFFIFFLLGLPPPAPCTDIMGHLVIMDRVSEIDVLGILQEFGGAML